LESQPFLWSEIIAHNVLAVMLLAWKNTEVFWKGMA
jgi:hypothetical protein